MIGQFIQRQMPAITREQWNELPSHIQNKLFNKQLKLKDWALKNHMNLEDPSFLRRKMKIHFNSLKLEDLLMGIDSQPVFDTNLSVIANNPKKGKKKRKGHKSPAKKAKKTNKAEVEDRQEESDLENYQKQYEKLRKLKEKWSEIYIY